MKSDTFNITQQTYTAPPLHCTTSVKQRVIVRVYQNEISD